MLCQTPVERTRHDTCVPLNVFPAPPVREAVYLLRAVHEVITAVTLSDRMLGCVRQAWGVRHLKAT
jgi:hypothetical protein